MSGVIRFSAKLYVGFLVFLALHGLNIGLITGEDIRMTLTSTNHLIFNCTVFIIAAMPIGSCGARDKNEPT